MLQIHVVFPPQQTEEELSARYLEETGEAVELEVRFEAEPPPGPGQVVWHLNSLQLAVGEEDREDDSGQFVVHPLEVEEGQGGHWVTARLTVNYLSLDQTAGDFYLEAANQFSGGEPTKYKFYLHFQPKPTTTTTTTTTTTSTETTILRRFSESPQVQTEGIRGGSIAAIVIIVILILIAAGSVFWLKKNKMFCFAEEGGPDRKDVEKEGEKVGNIYQKSKYFSSEEIFISGSSKI